MIRWIGWLTTVTAAIVLAVAPAASAQVQPYGTNDYGGFRNVLAPGTNGLDTLVQLGAFKSTGARPAHNDDQLQMYSGLATAAGGITAQTLPDYFKDATFGVPSGNQGSSESPEPGVTIVRDAQHGVPHIYGDTRAALMFGIGYATAEDRLFFIDVLRHSGQGDLASFAGGANVGMDESVWANEPYTPQDLTNQVQYAMSHVPDGPQIYADEMSYVDGINAYIAKAAQPLNALSMEPAEYAALGMIGGPAPFTLQDLVSIATLVGGIFGGGGGQQLNNAVLYESLAKRFGAEHFPVAGAPTVIPKPRRVRGKPGRRGKHGQRAKRVKRVKRVDHSGLATFLSFNAANDPEAPTTVAHTAFPYQTLPAPSRALARTVAMPDPGSVNMV
ncbi:MAG: penicillin acylase family protein, partial [Actinomycetota bacterium]|nr:penicillin acylase family protein [Actinomycetota bacterium]